jgi:hypothetical protein
MTIREIMRKLVIVGIVIIIVFVPFYYLWTKAAEIVTTPVKTPIARPLSTGPGGCPCPPGPYQPVEPGRAPPATPRRQRT